MGWKSKVQNIEITELQKLIKKRVREDTRKYNDVIIKEIIEESKSTKTEQKWR